MQWLFYAFHFVLLQRSKFKKQLGVGLHLREFLILFFFPFPHFFALLPGDVDKRALFKTLSVSACQEVTTGPKGSLRQTVVCLYLFYYF